MVLKNFIVFEGIDGSGTSTQIKLLAERLAEGGAAVTAEPTSGPTGLFLRRMLAGEFSVDARTAAYLFAADRCEHVYGKGGILEAAACGTVISDRYLFSSLAYQSVSCGDGLPEMLNSGFPLPSLLFYLAVAPEVSMARVCGRGNAREIYENTDFQRKTAALYEKVISGYEGTEKGKGMNVVRIDAGASIGSIAETVWSKVREYGLDGKR